MSREPSAEYSADASFADTDDAASRAGSEAAGDDIDDILEAVGQPDPKRKHDLQCDGLSETWRELPKGGLCDQSLPLRCGNGIVHLIRASGEALRLIEHLLPAVAEPDAGASGNGQPRGQSNMPRSLSRNSKGGAAGRG